MFNKIIDGGRRWTSVPPASVLKPEESPPAGQQKECRFEVLPLQPYFSNQFKMVLNWATDAKGGMHEG